MRQQKVVPRTSRSTPQGHVRGGIFRGALQIFEGDRGTVMIRNANGQGVILQRVGTP